MDSAFETASRAYLTYREKIALTSAHRDRATLVKTVKAKLKEIDDEVWQTLDFYHNEIRNDFYHESSGKTITDESLLDYQDTVEFLIDRAFGVRIGDLADAGAEGSSAEPVIEPTASPAESKPERVPRVALSRVSAKADKVLVAVAARFPRRVSELNEYFKREGERVRLKPEDFSSIVSRNSGSKKYFYFNRELRQWEPSGLGRFRLDQLATEIDDG